MNYVVVNSTWDLQNIHGSICVPRPCFYCTVYSKKYTHGYCFAVLCCGYTLTDFSISIRLTSLALWQSNDCPSASKATLMNMDKYFKWIHYERLHNHSKAKHNKTVCIFLGIYCIIRYSPNTSWCFRCCMDSFMLYSINTNTFSLTPNLLTNPGVVAIRRL